MSRQKNKILSTSPDHFKVDFPFLDPAVEQVFGSYPAPVREALLRLRGLILETARDLTDRPNGIGPVLETLKWGQPSYLPKKPKTGSTVRIDALKDGQYDFAMYFHCQTTLVTGFRERYPDQFVFEGNRALLFSATEPLPSQALSHCVAQALTYHLRPRIV